MLKMIQAMLEKENDNINKHSDVNDIKFNELKSDIHEQKIKCERNFDKIVVLT